mmetsp:Transcript_15388/g.46125  ORF Transcript_15388/g.46125 Transcript_15388/m.46125 type:complete len:258 (-) Transcript_15388:927-1700(-)
MAGHSFMSPATCSSAAGSPQAQQRSPTPRSVQYRPGRRPSWCAKARIRACLDCRSSEMGRNAQADRRSTSSGQNTSTRSVERIPGKRLRSRTSGSHISGLFQCGCHSGAGKTDQRQGSSITGLGPGRPSSARWPCRRLMMDWSRGHAPSGSRRAPCLAARRVSSVKLRSRMRRTSYRTTPPLTWCRDTACAAAIRWCSRSLSPTSQSSRMSSSTSTSPRSSAMTLSTSGGRSSWQTTRAKIACPAAPNAHPRGYLLR